MSGIGGVGGPSQYGPTGLSIENQLLTEILTLSTGMWQDLSEGKMEVLDPAYNADMIKLGEAIMKLDKLGVLSPEQRQKFQDLFVAIKEAEEEKNPSQRDDAVSRALFALGQYTEKQFQ